MNSDVFNTTSLKQNELNETSLQRSIKFSVFLILEPPSLICNVLLVYYLSTDKQLRQTLHYHIIFLLLLVGLCTNLIEVPRVLHFLRLGFVTPATKLSCLVWQWFDYLLFAESNWLMMWASFERHILVFHNQMFNTRKRRLLNHYFPMIFILIYLNLFYTIVIFFYPCSTNFNYNVVLCGQPCFTSSKGLSLFDLCFHSWLPVFLITFFSVGLIFRVFYSRKIRCQRRNQFRRYRRMIIQLLAISMLYLGFMGPYSTLEIIDNVVGLSSTANFVKQNYFFYMYWLITLLIPFICIGCLPEVTNKFHRQLNKLLNIKNSVAPLPTTIH